ncbi:DUF559 domain-containing protein, partial [bacterium]|nr:DUF559 domain-containing protein [bacterium]
INSKPPCDVFKNDFEKEVFESIIEEFPSYQQENKIKAGVEIGSVSSDIMIDKIIVEIDGVQDNIAPKFNDMKKQAILERAGYGVIRITKREWQISKNACLDRVRQALNA